MSRREETRLADARSLVAALEADCSEDVDYFTKRISLERDSSLFQEIGQLTRKMHDSLQSFQVDDRLAKLAEHEIPDARGRLLYVIERTERSAHKTMDLVERLLDAASAVSDGAKTQAAALGKPGHDPAILRTWLDAVVTQTDQAQDQLTEVLMGQDFQDITGQIIRRVIDLVQEVEESLVSMVRISGALMQSDPDPAPASEIQVENENERESLDGSTLEGPQVPGQETEGAVDGQGDVDSLLASFGF